MKMPFHSCSKPARFFGIALSLAASLSGFGALITPAASIAATTVSVAQQPLVLQPPIPPNIVMMVDDSGSMAWSIMPDASDLADSTLNGMRSSAVNGVYYNPNFTYSPPPKADSTATVPDMYPNNNVSGVPGTCVPGFPYAYSSPFSNCTNNTTPTQDVTQASGSVGNSSSGTTGSFPFYDNFYKQCDINGNCSNYQLDTTGVCTNPSSGTACIGAFAYTTGSASAGYVTHYVSSDCTKIPSSNCVNASDTSGTSAPSGVAAGQNVMNWYSYYSSRIKMARSGLMTAFSGVDPGFRVGFGSINGTNNGALPSPTGVFGANSNKIAEVQPFGTGSSGSQKANFWAWVSGLNPNSNTPLRYALDAVGQYYGTSQPWSMMSSDPGYVSGANTQIACRQAYTILTTDGFWNRSYSGVGNADGTAGTQITGANGQTYTYSPVGPYSDTYSDTLADVAMHYWATDLSTMPNEVPPSSVDPAFWQHMVTFTMGLGYTPTGITGTAPNGDNPPTTQDIFNWANDGGGSSSRFAITNFSWPQPSVNSPNNIADLEHAGVNGHGGFFSATDPQTFVNGLVSALQRATSRVGTGASLAANSTQLNTGTVIYQANYFTSTWAGDLKALKVNPVTGAISSSPMWQAATAMPDAASRNIQTWNGSSFVSFQNGTGTPPSLSTAQLNALGGDAPTQQNIVNYLRGDHSLEQQHGGTLRTRHLPPGQPPTGGDWTLGDVVNSQPVFSGPPDPNEFINQSFYGTTVDSTTNTVPFYTWAVGTTDSSGTFHASAASTRTPYIFVAANDGMLHAFNATTGVEAFAYLPGAVITAGLANLANPAYGSAAYPHQFYNDGQMTIADAYLPSLPQINGSSWHTILVGTTGRGPAEAVYALDVTDPGNITPLWERSAGDGLTNAQYIGQMVGKPVIAQTNATSTSSTWSVLIGNGYNSAIGQAALLQFNLATGALNVHATDSSTGNGLAAPVAWMDNPADGVSDIAYAGDLLGRVWSFPLNDTTGSNPTPTSAGTKLFTAKDSSGNVQPITAGMLAGSDPSTGNVWLFFGTGQYLSSADLTNLKTQTWYGIIVQSGTNKIVSNLSNGRSALVQRTITAQTAGGSGSLPARTVSTQTVVNTNGTTDMTGKSGWYLDLLAPIGTGGTPVQQGERMVDPNEFQGSLLIGVTRIPQVTDICNPSGSGWIMALNPFTGAAPSGDFFDVNNDGYVNAGDQLNGQHAAGVGFGSLPNAPIFVGGIMETSFDNGTTSSLKTAGTIGTMQRVTWREVVNP